MSSTFTNLLFHIVYSTKYRRNTIDASWQSDLYRYICGIVKDRDGTVIEIGGVANHIHIVAKLSPKFAIMDVLRDTKAGSSKWVNDQRLVRNRFEWQSGYGAFSVSQSHLEDLIAYVRNQEAHHRGSTFESEFVALLRKHQIDFELKYVFEDEHIG